MNKREFLRQLEDVLSFELPSGMVRENLEYYSAYIDGEVRSGKRLEEVLDALGDPSLIARSIIDAAKSGADGIPYTDDDVDFRAEAMRTESDYGYQQAADCGTFDESGRAACEEPRTGRAGTGSTGQSGAGSGWHPIYTHHANFGCLAAVLIFFALTIVVSTLLTALAPILMPLLVVAMIIWLFKSFTGKG